ncbi:GAF and ANTAR domain-containing protein [Amycolatopsis anabasis]|uniref:GAF and ANTAR domain-containing protein n=1 Tax=Amycolatopsis anabasis TaxID=1840409 RepID=UPI00131B9B34|nr:GAF and ANTAR domain-containing protein [Amycolatopsis anabasis]
MTASSEDPARSSALEDGRAQRLFRTFVALADTLVDDFDILDFLSMLAERCVDLLEISAAGVILIDQKGGLRVASASSERAELLELFAVQTQDGPCIDCVRDGQPVASSDLTAEHERWPGFTAAAHECGFRAAQALPMRLRRQVVGVLTLLNTQPDGVDEESTQLGQALADVATVGILQQRAIERNELLSEQLQTALNSRVVIEQAKGVLSEHGGNLDMDDAFTRLRGYARAHNQRLSELAHAVAEGTADLDAILTPTPRHDHDTHSTAPPTPTPPR